MTDLTEVLRSLNNVVDAWESLPGGRQVPNKDIERWINGPMADSINEARRVLNRPKPKV